MPNPQRRPRSTATVLTLLTCLIGTAVAAVPSSSAQSVTGPFVPAQSWWIGPGGTTGFVTDGVTITFDTNGDGLLGAGDHSHPLPQQIRYGTMVLSPTRRALIAWVDNPSLCGAESPVALWFYAIPAEDGASLELLNGPQCLGGFMGPMGFYEHPGASDQRICYVIEVGVGSEQQVFWVDLESGSGSFTQNPLSSSIESVAFAPSGIAAFVKHGTGGFDGLADYSLVNLCDGSLGSLVNPAGGGLFDLPVPPEAVARVEDDGSGPVAIVDYPAGVFLAQATLTDCAGGPVAGACCPPGGGCIEALTASECGALGGSFQGAGTDCAGAACPPPPAPDLHISKTGPDSAVEGAHITYTLTYRNDGNGAASSVFVNDALPALATFVSATGGGYFNNYYQRVMWDVGGLAPGASTQVSFTVAAPCGFSGALTNDQYWIQADNVPPVYGPDAVTTTISGDTGPVTVTLTSVPQTPPPLGDLDVVVHTITLANSAPNARTGLTLDPVFWGAGMELDAVLDAGGGTVDVSAQSFTWEGSLPASGSTQIVVATRVDACRNPSIVETALHDGRALVVRNPCGLSVGTVTPGAPLALIPPVVQVELVPTGAGPAAWMTGLGDPRLVALALSGANLELEARIHNESPSPQTGISITVAFPPGLTPAGDPPFVGTPPNGTTWSQASRTIQWTGSLAALEQIVIRFAASVDPSHRCAIPLALFGQTAGCTANLRAQAELWPLSPAPSADHLLGLRPFGGIWSLSLAGGAPDTMLCPSVEVQSGLGIDHGTGVIHVAGLPAFSFNPATLELQFPAVSDWGMDYPVDVAADASDGTCLWGGHDPASGVALIVRHDAAGATTTPVFRDSSGLLGRLEKFVLDRESRIVALMGGRVVRIEPSDPGNPVVYDLGGPLASSVAIDADGDYLAPEFYWGQTNPRRLFKIDRISGAVSLAIQNLNALLPNDAPYAGVAVEPSGLIYAAPQFGNVGSFDRVGAAGTDLGVGGLHSDLMLMSAGPPVDVKAESRTSNALALRPVKPNPARPGATFAFSLPRAGPVRLGIYDVQGRLVRTLGSGPFPGGEHSVVWNGEDAAGALSPAGIYYLRVQWEGAIRSQKFAFLR